MPLVNTLGALVSAKNVIGTVPTGLGYVASSSTSDALNWSGTNYTANSVVSNTVITDSSGNMYTAYRLPPGSGMGDGSIGVVAKLSINGTQLVGGGARDSRTISGSSVPVQLFGTAFDSAGNIYSAGLGARIVGSTYYEQPLVCKNNTSGGLAWSYLYYSGTTPAIAQDIKIDASDNIYVLVNAGYLLKLDTNGTLIWSKNASGGSLALAESGNLIKASSGTSNSAITKIDPNANIIWNCSINTSGVSDVYWLNNIVYVATTSGVITLNGTTGAIINQISFNTTFKTARISADSSGNVYYGGVRTFQEDIFVASLDSSLGLRWRRIIDVNPDINYPDSPYLSGIAVHDTSMYIVFNHYSDLISGGEIRSMYAMRLPTNGKILMRGQYVLEDNVIVYSTWTAGGITPTTFTGSVSTGGTYSSVTLTRVSVPLGVAGAGNWYDKII